MQSVTCFIGLGSNLLDPQRQLENAIKSLTKLPQSRLLAHSSFYQSNALVEQSHLNESKHAPSDYFNAVAKLETTLLPFDLLKQLQSIEQQQGRKRYSDNRWASRTLDLDILLYAKIIIQTQALIIPHYAIRERDFVLKPLLEIENDFIFQDSVKASDLLQQCDDNNLRKVLGTADNL